MTAIKCCALRDPARGVKGGCRRSAKASLLGTCCLEHRDMVEKYVKEQATAYAGLVKECEDDTTGMLSASADAVRTIIIKTLVEEATVEAQQKTLAIQERLLASLERSKNKRKAFEEDERFVSVSSKRAKLLDEEDEAEAEEAEAEVELDGVGAEEEDFNPFEEVPEANLALNRERVEDGIAGLGVRGAVEQYEAMM